MSGPVVDITNATAAVRLIQGIADNAGVDMDAGAVLKLAGELIQSGIELVDTHAKAHAKAAGAAKAAALTTEDGAEAAQRKP